MRCIEVAGQHLENSAADLTSRDVTDVSLTESTSKVCAPTCSDCIYILYHAASQKPCLSLAYVAALQLDDALHSVVHTIKKVTQLG